MLRKRALFPTNYIHLGNRGSHSKLKAVTPVLHHACSDSGNSFILGCTSKKW